MTFHPYEECSRNSAKNTVMTLCEDPSSLFCWRLQETQLFSSVLWVARIEVSVAATWVVSPACWELLHHLSLEKLHSKHIWKTCFNTGTVSCFVTNLSVPEGFCTWYALLEYSGYVLISSFRLGSPPILQSLFLDWPQSLVLIEDLSYNEFFKAHHHSLLNQLGNPFWVWFGHVAPFRFHLSRGDHLQKGLWFLPQIRL